MNNEDAIALILHRNQFYRRQYLLAFSVFCTMLLVMAGMVLLLFHVMRHADQPIYFATDNAGRLIDVLPVSKPNMTTEQAAAWAVNAVQKATTFNYVNYRDQIQSAEKYFTNFGWRSYLAALNQTGNLIAVKERQYIIESRVFEQPTLVTEGKLGGAYAWKFKMPLILTVWKPPYDETSRFQNAWKVEVIVQRQSILQSVDGVAVLQLLIVT